MEQEKTLPDIYGMTPEEVKGTLTAIGFKGFKVNDVLRWCYGHCVSSWEEMTTLTKAEREKLSENFALSTFAVKNKTVSPDGTVKLLYELWDGRHVESVLIPDESRLTLCVSTQVGCPVRCGFCASGLFGLRRNLSTGEIVGQFVTSARIAEERLTNVVIMGMGEPFFNFDNVMRAVTVLHHPDGLGLGLRKITLSTVGIQGQIDKIFTAPLYPNLAISLHAPTDEIRRAIIPHRKALSVQEIVEFVRRYNAQVGHRVTLEYVLLSGVNASQEEARALGRLFRNLYVQVNLIPFNPVEGSLYAAPSEATVNRFAEIVSSYGITTTVRTRHGDAIDAACGQLRLKEIAKELVV